MDASLHGAEGQVQRLGDLLVRQVLLVSQHHDDAVMLGKAVDELGGPGFLFGVGRDLVGLQARVLHVHGAFFRGTRFTDLKRDRLHPPATEMVDRETMRRTLKKVFEVWDWPSTWGWDYPMIAMTAARLGESKLAIDALMVDTPKNKYLPNGHNYQRPNLPLYLPGNGGLLYAIALMAAGWKGSPKTHAPGFPQDGSWTVRAEGFDRRIFEAI